MKLSIWSPLQSIPNLVFALPTSPTEKFGCFNKSHHLGFQRRLPLSILRDSESLAMAASEWGSMLPQLLLCPRGRWACENREETLQANRRPNGPSGHGHVPVSTAPMQAHMAGKAGRRNEWAPFIHSTGKGRSPILPRSSVAGSTQQ